MLVHELLSEILNVSEKAAELARCIRKEDLFSILIQEKTGVDKNSRFEMDYKTLADVLIQEMIRFDLENKFPGIGKRIFGEESNQFTNTLGENVTVSISHDETETLELLRKAFDGNLRVAEILLRVITSNFTVENTAFNNLRTKEIDVGDLGIWVDPIDSTFEYINGNFNERPSTTISRSGLPNVTVLIGVFSWSTGLPFLGVINQPFFERKADEPWKGRALWGIQTDEVTSHGNPFDTQVSDSNNLILTSTSDVDMLRKNFADSDITIIKAPGAGYKQLCVIDGLALVYILFNFNTYRWDCCGPHGILRSMGGGILRLSDTINCIDIILNSDGETRKDILLDLQMTYKVPGIERKNSKDGIESFSNKEGLLAYRDEETLFRVLKILKKGLAS